MLLRGSGFTDVEETRNRSIDKGAMASKEEIVPSRVTVNPNNHVVVRVLDRGSEMVAKAMPDDNMAWVLGDDFNSILSSEERIGGSSRRDDAMWSDSKVLHLNRLDSNHGPLLLVIDSVTVPKRQHGFKYLAAWQSSSGFEDMLA
ncbi:hypothetical protein V6N13_012831 [Hibiscus sabdariffa]